MIQIKKSDIEETIGKYYNCKIKQVATTSSDYVKVEYEKCIGTKKVLGIFNKRIYEPIAKQVQFAQRLVVTSENRLYGIVNDSVAVRIAYDEEFNVAYWKYEMK